MWQYFFKSLKIVGWLMLALLAFLGFLVSTSSGLSFSLSVAEELTDHAFSFEQVEGSVLGGFTITHLAYRTGEWFIQANTMTIEWESGFQSLQLKTILGVHFKEDSLAKLKLAGEVFPHVYLPIHLSVPHLNKLKGLMDASMPPLSGKVNIQGLLEGAPSDLNLEAQMEVAEFQLEPVYLKKLRSYLTLRHFFTDQPFATLTVELKPGDLFYIQEKKPKIIPFKTFEMRAEWKNDNLQAQWKWIFDAFKRINTHVQVSPMTLDSWNMQHLEQQHLKGVVKVHVNSLDFLNLPASPVQKVKGKLATTLTLGGTLAHPDWNGSAKLNAAASIPELGITLDPVSLQVKSSPKRFALQGKVTSSGQTILIKGSSKMLDINKGVYQFNGRITGEHVLVMNTNEYQIYASPHLTFQWKQDEANANQLTLRGDIDIPSARITPLDFSSAETLPSDVVFVSSEKEKSTTLFQLDSQIQLRLGKEITIQTHGVKGQLEGSVMVFDRNNTPTTGEGEIRLVKGSYDAYGQTLEVTTGKINFAGGPIENPQLLVRAVRTFDNSNDPFSDASMSPASDIASFNKMTVGVEVTGTVDDPVVRLFSEPATLSQADILSLLVLGRPMSQASAADGALLMRALSALNVGGEQQATMMEQLQQTFGLDVLSIETHSQYDAAQNSTSSNTSLVIGKKLSPRLYVDYSIGLMQGSNILKIKYFLTPHWIVQTSSDGVNEGADIIYRITRD